MREKYYIETLQKTFSLLYLKVLKNKIFIFFFLFYFFLFTLPACNTTEPPPPDDNNQYLEYEWTIDTLRNPNGYGIVPWSMWGSSDSSVWIAGFNLAGQGELFHWNGDDWIRVTPDLGFNYELTSVYGFSENNVYITGYRIIRDSIQRSESLILYYDGNSLKQETIPIKSDALLYLHGTNPSNIWACGPNGSLYHKTGGIWTKIPFDEKKYLGPLSEQPDLGPIYSAPNGEVFIMNEYYNYKAYGDTAMFYFSKYSNHTWQDLDSCRLVNIDGIPTGYKFGNKAIWGVSENEIYSAGDAVFKFDGNNWAPVYWDNLYRDIKGTRENKIFAVGNHGMISYFNSGWSRIGDFSRFIVDFYSVMPFEDKIFIGAYQLGVGYVVRGKRK